MTPSHVRAALGRQGEDMAAHYLIDQGYAILFRNYRAGRYEIDIIAIKEKILHFIEVKTRAQSAYGAPEESVKAEKIRRMLEAASVFQEKEKIEQPWEGIQFDIVAIRKKKTGAEIYFIEDIYI